MPAIQIRRTAGTREGSGDIDSGLPAPYIQSMNVIEFDSEASWVAFVEAEVAATHASRLERGETRMDIVLAGGATPAPIYRALAAHPFSGLELTLWLGDERFVGADNPARNGRMVAAAFAASIWDPPPRIHEWPFPPLTRRLDDAPEGLAADLAAAGELCLKQEALLRAELGPEPRFSLALLGLGPDGHTASLFPGQPILAELGRLCGASLAPGEPRVRMSFTYPLLAGAQKLRFLVRGRDKADIVRRLAAEETELPASRVAVPDRAILYCLN